MKAKILSVITTLIITAVVAFNINLNLNKKDNTPSLVLENVEALAKEHGGFNWPWDWDDGLTKDEYEYKTEAQAERTISGTFNLSPSGSVSISIPGIGSASVSSQLFSAEFNCQSKETYKYMKTICEDGGFINCD